jgi:hypothetical protein
MLLGTVAVNSVPPLVALMAAATLVNVPENVYVVPAAFEMVSTPSTLTFHPAVTGVMYMPYTSPAATGMYLKVNVAPLPHDPVVVADFAMYAYWSISGGLQFPQPQDALGVVLHNSRE